VVFFAPQRIRDRAQEWGWPVLEQRYQAALENFAADTGSWLRILRHHGLDDAAAAYRDVLNNTGSPAEAHLIDMTARQREPDVRWIARDPYLHLRHL
jgi:hypothetical protein